MTGALVALAVEAFATVAGHAPSVLAFVAFVGASAVLGTGVATWMVMRVDGVRRLLGLQPRRDHPR
ncbi:MAG TPA: hypothetical protein VL422_01485 [Miltoncostaea sp.]|nr:hypothetical protein [Miltoncostaea sp.]